MLNTGYMYYDQAQMIWPSFLPRMNAKCAQVEPPVIIEGTARARNANGKPQSVQAIRVKFQGMYSPVVRREDLVTCIMARGFDPVTQASANPPFYNVPSLLFNPWVVLGLLLRVHQYHETYPGELIGKSLDVYGDGWV
jgi:hypothetical protein